MESKQEEKQGRVVLIHMRGDSFKWKSVHQSQLQECPALQTKDDRDIS
jgi:hypothetical protein